VRRSEQFPSPEHAEYWLVDATRKQRDTPFNRIPERVIARALRKGYIVEVKRHPIEILFATRGTEHEDEARGWEKTKEA